MKVVTVKREEKVIFRVEDIPQKYAVFLEQEYYTYQEGGYLKSYPADLPYMERASANFEKYGEEMFYQRWGIKPSPWQGALSYFIQRMKGTGIKWLLIGSCVMAIRGMDVEPRGVDVLIESVHDLARVRELLWDTVIEPITECDGWVAKAYGSAFCGASLHIAFEPASSLDLPDPMDAGPYALARKDPVEG